MAVRVKNGASIELGLALAAAVTATHGRIQKAGADPFVRPLTDDIVAAAGEVLRIPLEDLTANPQVRGIELVYKTGELSDAHIDALVRGYFDGQVIQVDLMTDDSTVVADANYAQATHSGWTFATEAD